ncbi:MAG: TetR/AcrR family transcriptional regulator [Aquabacterium sp.]
MSKSSEASQSVKSRTYSGVPAEERTRIRRERLIEAATEVFGRVGYAQATMRNICVEARLAERYFYESFDSTKTIFETVCRAQIDQMIHRIGEALAQSPVMDKDFIESGVRAFLEFVREDPRRVQIVLIDGVWMDQMRAREGKSEIVGYGRVIRNLTQGFHPDLARQINVEMAASGLIGMAIHTAIDWARGDFAMTLEEVLKHNMYAWAGLGYWARNAHKGGHTKAAQAERRAWVRKAFNEGNEDG